MTGDIIFTGTITVSGKSNVRITSTTGARLISDGSWAYSGGLFFIENSSSVTFSGLQFMGGNAYYEGGCVYVHYSTVNIRNSIFTSCTATYRGAGVYYEASTAIFNHTTFSSCSATYFGGGGRISVLHGDRRGRHVLKLHSRSTCSAYTRAHPYRQTSHFEKF